MKFVLKLKGREGWIFFRGDYKHIIRKYGDSLEWVDIWYKKEDEQDETTRGKQIYKGR